MKCPDCESELEFKEGLKCKSGLSLIGTTKLCKWICTNKECQAEHFTDEFNRFLNDEEID